MKHEVIMYRNPGEAAIWDWILNGSGGNVILWGLCAFVVFLLFAGNQRRLEYFHPYILIVAGLVATHLLYLGASWALTYL